MGKKLLSILVDLFCVAAILFSLLAGWTVLTTPRGQAPRIFGCSVLTVLTGSMEPALPELSLILVRETPAQDIRAGDVITFYTTLAGQDGVLNTHRVTEVVRDGGGLSFRTKGDANSLADPTPVPSARVLGRVVWHSAALGVAVSLLRRPYVFLPLVLIPLFLLILRSLLRIWRLAKAEIDRAEQELKEEQGHDHRP